MGFIGSRECASTESREERAVVLLATVSSASRKVEYESEPCINLHNDGQAEVCSNRCTTDLNCVSGFSCERLLEQETDTERVCIAEDLCVDADNNGHEIGPGCIGADGDEDEPSRYVKAPEDRNGNDDDCDGGTDHGIPEVDVRCSRGELELRQRPHPRKPASPVPSARTPARAR